MTSKATDKNSKDGCSNQTCRLCMSKESLEEVFKHDQLHKWITDFLSIKISNEDRMSQSICAECRNRLVEFHRYWVRCKEVQGILHAKVRAEDLRQKSERSECEVCNKVFKTRKLLMDHKRYNHRPKKYVCTSCGKSFAKRPQLENHVKIHAKEVNDYPKHTMEENNIIVHENLDLKAEPCEEDDFSCETYSHVGEPTVGAEIDNLSENYRDFDQNQVKLEPVTISLPLLDGQDEIVDKGIQDDGEQDFTIEDIIVVEKVKIETRSDDNEELSANETFETTNEVIERKLSTNHDIADDSNNMNDYELGTRGDYQTPLPDAQPAKVKSYPVKGKPRIGLLECDICHKVVSDKRKLKDHKRCHKPKEHVCSICEKPFLRRPALLKHMETHISRPNNQRSKPVKG